VESYKSKKWNFETLIEIKYSN